VQLIMFNPNVVVKNIVTLPSVENIVTLIARILMAYIFVITGWGKLTG
jgi:putative oxidoreductase